MRAIIVVAQELMLDVTAEGVETAEQVAFLKSPTAASEAQGFYFARPMPADEMRALLGAGVLPAAAAARPRERDGARAGGRARVLPVDAAGRAPAIAGSRRGSGVSAAIFLAALPFAKVPLAPVGAFIPIYESALVINDLITAGLLFGQFSHPALARAAGARRRLSVYRIHHRLRTR